MTDKEKAKAYDEALALAKRLISNNCTEVEKLCLKCVFPELKESEDERIRKALCEFISDTLGDELDGYDISKNEALTYLEKQKEQSITANDLDEEIHRFFDDCIEVHDAKIYGVDERVITVDCYEITARHFAKWGEKQKEQKPVECIEFDNEFENQVSHLLASVLNGEWEYNEDFVKYAAQSLLRYAKNEIKSSESDKIERLMKALQATNAQIGELVEENYKLKEQKPAEWSEEDEQRIAEIEFAVMQMNTKRVDTKDKCLAWLKSLRPQLKQKWSEEDEENINTLIEVVHERMGLSEKRKQYYEKWLKSLRHKPHTVSTKDATKFGNLEYERGVKDGIQSEKSRQWKPTEEQIYSFSTVVKGIGNVSVGSVEYNLKALYEQLKKLM